MGFFKLSLSKNIKLRPPFSHFHELLWNSPSKLLRSWFFCINGGIQVFCTEWTFSLCWFPLDSELKCFPLIRQGCGFSFSCTKQKCDYNSPFVQNLKEQDWQSNGFKFLWILSMWALRFESYPNFSEQIWHANSFCFSWALLWCSFKRLLITNFKGQRWHSIG